MPRPATMTGASDRRTSLAGAIVARRLARRSLARAVAHLDDELSGLLAGPVPAAVRLRPRSPAASRSSCAASCRTVPGSSGCRLRATILVVLAVVAFGMLTPVIGYALGGIRSPMIVGGLATPRGRAARTRRASSVGLIAFSVVAVQPSAQAADARPSSCPASGSRLMRPMLADLGARLLGRAHASTISVSASRLPDRHADRRAARHRADRDHLDPAALHLRHLAGRLDDHARRHLLRRAVRRLDHGDPGAHAGRGRARSSRCSTATRWRARAAPARRWRWRPSARSSPAASRRSSSAPSRDRSAGRAASRPGGLLRAHRARPRVRRSCSPAARSSRPSSSVLIGVILASVGTDVETGVQRLTFGHAVAARGHRHRGARDGVLRRRRDPAQSRGHATSGASIGTAIGRLWPSRDEMRRSALPALRGTAIGSLLGILPGSGTLLAPFASYVLEKKLVAAPGAIRQGRAGGRRGAGSRQQRRGADLLHPADEPRPAAERRDGADARRADDPGHRARPAGLHQEPGSVLGHGRLDVDRQPDAARHQPAADRALGLAAAGALPPALSRRSCSSAASASTR